MQARPVSEERALTALEQGSCPGPLAEQAGNPDGSGTTSQHIGNPSHDTGTPAQVCSKQVMRPGDAARPSGSPRALPALRKRETERLGLLAHGQGTQASAQRGGFWEG